jgi:hypothetical protein
MAAEIVLPRFVRTLLANCPAAGQGVHRWLFCVARCLHAFMPEHEEIAQLLQVYTPGCGRHVSRREIDDAIRDSRRCAWRPGEPRTVKPDAPKQWPVKNYERIEAIARVGPCLYDLWEESPRRFEDNESHTEEIIDALFRDDQLLCCGSSPSQFATKLRSEWRGILAGQQFIVPSPMAREFGKTRDGKMSAHSLDNTGPRHFLIVEFDFLPEDLSRICSGKIELHDLCASLVFHLNGFAPLTLVVHSGGKSLHSWFYCARQPEDKLHKFMRYAVSIGGDPHTWLRSQFVRMPDGLRTGGIRQTAFFFNPAYAVHGVN